MLECRQDLAQTTVGLTRSRSHCCSSDHCPPVGQCGVSPNIPSPVNSCLDSRRFISSQRKGTATGTSGSQRQTVQVGKRAPCLRSGAAWRAKSIPAGPGRWFDDMRRSAARTLQIAAVGRHVIPLLREAHRAAGSAPPASTVGVKLHLARVSGNALLLSISRMRRGPYVTGRGALARQRARAEQLGGRDLGPTLTS